MKESRALFLQDRQPAVEVGVGGKHERVVVSQFAIVVDLAPKFYPVLSSLQRFLVAVVGSLAAGCGAEPFRLRGTASRRGLKRDPAGPAI